MTSAIGYAQCPGCQASLPFERNATWSPAMLKRVAERTVDMHLRAQWGPACPNRCTKCRGNGKIPLQACSGFGAKRTYMTCYECAGKGYRLPKPVPANVVLGDG